jgi:hypothetical protein
MVVVGQVAIDQVVLAEAEAAILVTLKVVLAEAEAAMLVILKVVDEHHVN